MCFVVVLTFFLDIIIYHKIIILIIHSSSNQLRATIVIIIINDTTFRYRINIDQTSTLLRLFSNEMKFENAFHFKIRIKLMSLSIIISMILLKLIQYLLLVVGSINY